uniref:Uncharacterized protein n=1 Tax=Mycena chlorophos TaxID=658473 RepID=A0ABQ0M3J9_MYCCL|nr:predicted protein [Mycena chlorophos]
MSDHAHVKVEDGAIERQSRMREDQFRHFRWTQRTLRSTFWGAVFIPVGLYLAISASTNKWDWTAKKQGESLSKA